MSSSLVDDLVQMAASFVERPLPVNQFGGPEGCYGSRAPIDALNKRKFGGSPRPDTFNVSSTPDTGH